MPIPTSEQAMAWLKPEPASAQELEWAEMLKPGDYEVYSEKLNNIALEAKEVFVRTGITSMLRSGDLIVAIYTLEGDMVTGYCGTYLHAVGVIPALKYIYGNWRDNLTVGIKEGDIFYYNDTLYGGIHNCDQTAMMPIFYDNELVAWAAACAHQPETGAIEPAGMPVTAKSRYDEGMKLSPIKIGTNYRIHDDIMEMMANMVGRTPRMQVTDVRARVAACDRIRVRLQSLVKEKGKEFVRGLFRKMIMVSESGARERIRGWNDGIYRAVIFSDLTGVEPGLTRLCLTLHKEGDHLLFDFTGTSPENLSPWNAFPHVVVAHATVYLYAYPFWDLPISSGLLTSMDWRVPQGTVYNASPVAACSRSTPLCGTVISLVSLVFAKMMFDSEQRTQVAAPLSTGIHNVFMVGVNQWGVAVSDVLPFAMNTMGHGARCDMDGVNAYGFAWCHTGRSPDAEDVENEFPVLILSQRHRKDSCGFGKYRGGAGGEILFTTHHMPQMTVPRGSSGSNKIMTGQGLFGGYPASVSPSVRVTDSDLEEMMRKGDKEIPTSVLDLVTKRAVKGKYEFTAAMVPPLPLRKGDLCYGTAIGGQGYGDVLERDPELVIKDLREDLISDWVVRNIYQVAYNSQSLKVDEETTKKLRQKEREARLQRGKTYESFQREWRKKQPPQEILEWYGSWPDAKKVKEIVRL